MKLIFHGHATFTLLIGGKTLLIDPFITDNPKCTEKDLSQYKPDYILVTHAHGDHVADVEAIAQNSGAQLISNYEITTYYGEKGLKGHPLNHGGKVQLDKLTIKYVNAVHSSVLPDGTYGGNSGGFVIWDETKCIYIAGDTALTMDMKLIPMTCPKLDVAILPIGDNFTMGYEDAAIASEFISCQKIIGCHYDTFGYIEIDKPAAINAFKEKSAELILLDSGETFEL